MKSIALFLADGFEEIEAVTVIDILRRGGIQVDIISVSGKNTVKGRTDINITADKTGVPQSTEGYDGLVLPGGMPGTENLRNNKALCHLITEFNRAGKLVGAICAAPTVLGSLNLLEGKEACCYPGFEEELIGAKTTNKPVCVDGNIITSRGIGTAIDFSLTLCTYLLDKKTADEVARRIVYTR